MPTAIAPFGLTMPAGPRDARTPNVTTDEGYLKGWFEVQDQGSQIVAALAGAREGEQVLDLCAGAGGKTLQLAAAMNNQGALLACDIDRARLQRLAPRAERAGASIIESRLLNPGREAEMLADWAAKADGAAEIMVGGGAQIYEEALPLADRMYLTEVALEPEGDTHFPRVNWAEWQETGQIEVPLSPKDTAAFRVRVYQRLRNP